MNIYKNKEKLNFEDISFSNFEILLNQKLSDFKDHRVDFSMITLLQGNSELLDKSFQDQKKESLNLD